MPADLEEALKKKGGLTLTQLAAYDDIITDALVDRVYYWGIIRKVRPNARPCRGVREEDVCKVLQRKVILDKDPQGAVKTLLAQAGFQAYVRSLRTEDEKEHFERHLRKYVNIYLPDCPFEVCTTHRYTITTGEASVVARKPIRAGEVIKYLSGIQVEMTEEEEAGLSSRTDFSIVLSSRRKRPSLFLGPARFANHDCDSNARLTTTGPHGITIVACKNIAEGDEITVRYGDDYFGEDNCECLCGTCEEGVKNGWDPRGPVLQNDTSDEESENESPRPRKRRRTGSIFDHPTVRRTTSQSSPRKRTQEPVIKQEPDILFHRKRGRPRKHPISVNNITPEYTAYARDFLARWIELRARQNDEDVDVIQVKRAMARVDSLSTEKAARKKHINNLEAVLKIMESHTEAKIKYLTAKTAELEASNAAALEMTVEETKKYYAPPGHPDFIPLPRTRSQLKRNVSSLDDSVRGKPKARLSPSTSRLATFKGIQRASPLRKVISAEDALLADGTTHTSTDDSSRSSIFSNESNADASSSSSSYSDMKSFSAGNICQNIVEMYTSGAPRSFSDDDEDDMHDAVQEQIETEQAVAGRSKREPSSRRDATSHLAMDSIEQQASTSDVDAADDEEHVTRGPPRIPGDYNLTAALLVEINDRWVDCRVEACGEPFVQHDAYQTRYACPRCERHSKLYGYQWPKTDKAGKDDKEERILDHRLIHRFIDPDEERQERKGRKTLAEMIREREMSASQEVDSGSSDSRGESRRRSRRLN